jgi:hypothetical protein
MITCTACTIIRYTYFSLFSAKSNLTRLVKKQIGIVHHSVFLSFCKQSVDTCIEVCQCEPSYTINEKARTLVTKERIYWRRSRGGVKNPSVTRAHVSQESRAGKTTGLFVIYNIDLAIYYHRSPSSFAAATFIFVFLLPNPIPPINSAKIPLPSHPPP